MTSADRDRGDQLNDQLDARATGAPEAARPADPIMAETVRRLFSRDDAPPPPHGLERQIWEDLMNQPAVAGAVPPPLSIASPSTLPPLSGRAKTPARRGLGPVWAPAGQMRSQTLGRVLLAALLLAALVGARLALETGGSGPSRPAALPAAVISPAAAATPALEATALIDILLPPGAVPAEVGGLVSFQRVSLDPGPSYKDWGCPTPKLLIGYVETGRYAITAQGPVDVLHGGARRTVPAGVRVDLTAGDGFVYVNAANEGYAGFLNPGPAPSVQLQASWYPITTCVPVSSELLGEPKGHHLLWETSLPATVTVDPRRATHFTLRTVVAQPNVMLSSAAAAGIGSSPPELVLFERVRVEAGSLEVGVVAQSDPGRVLPGTRKTYLASVGQDVLGMAMLDGANLQRGLAWVVSSAGPGPLRATVFTVTYAAPPASATPTP